MGIPGQPNVSEMRVFITYIVILLWAASGFHAMATGLKSDDSMPLDITLREAYSIYDIGIVVQNYVRKCTFPDADGLEFTSETERTYEFGYDALARLTSARICFGGYYFLPEMAKMRKFAL